MTIEFKAEAAAVAEPERERFTPYRLSATPLHAIAKGITQTVAALHENSASSGTQLVGCQVWEAVEITGNAIGNVVKVGGIFEL